MLSAPANTASVTGGTEFPDQFVASFGKDAALGCFTAAEPMTLSRRQRVLLKTPRGLEVGEALGPATLRQARLLGAQAQGDLLRPITADDRPVIDRMATIARETLAAGEELAHESDMTLSLLDAEALFDLRHVLLHVLHPDPDQLTDFVAHLCDRTGFVIRIANLVLPAEPHGCGEPNCGGGDCTNGGCSTGGCATGCGSNAPDLRPYFAHLRDKLETDQRVHLL